MLFSATTKLHRVSNGCMCSMRSVADTKVPNNNNDTPYWLDNLIRITQSFMGPSKRKDTKLYLLWEILVYTSALDYCNTTWFLPEHSNRKPIVATRSVCAYFFSTNTKLDNVIFWST